MYSSSVQPLEFLEVWAVRQLVVAWCDDAMQAVSWWMSRPTLAGCIKEGCMEMICSPRHYPDHDAQLNY